MNEEDYKNSLTQMILKYYHYKVPGLVWGQMKNYHDKLGMNYEGLYKTFLYVLEVKGLTFEAKYGIGYVKFFYQEGHNYVKRSNNDKPQIKTSRRKIIIKKQKHRPVVKKIHLDDIELKKENTEHD